VPVPLFTPSLSSLWIHLVTPVDAAIARPLAEGLRNGENGIAAVFEERPRGYTDRAKKSPEIHRMIEGRLEKKGARESDRVSAGDTVHVPARWW